MKAGAVTVLGGLTVIGTAAALYFWPSNAGEECPSLSMTAAELDALPEPTEDQIYAAWDSASARDECLLREYVKYSQLGLPQPLEAIGLFVRWPFVQDDLAKLQAAHEESWAVTEAAMRLTGPGGVN